MLLSLHDELDAAVLQAYGWTALRLPADADRLLHQLAELNARRAAEEAQGRVRWLRPAFQQAGAATEPEPPSAAQPEPVATPTPSDPPVRRPARAKAQPWPKTLPGQIGAVQALLTAQPQSVETLAARFSARPVEAVREVLDALLSLGLIRRVDDGYAAASVQGREGTIRP